jgi:hypothetical protein
MLKNSLTPLSEKNTEDVLTNAEEHVVNIEKRILQRKLHR